MIENRALRYGREFYQPTNPGQRLNDVYKLEYNDDGTCDLVVVDKIDTYAEIQSYADSVDLHKIIERCTLTGDYSPLYQTEGFYADMTIMPKTRAEALQAIADAENTWKKLPVEAKEKFDNDMNKFFATAFTDEWFAKLEIPREVKEEVKVGEDNE